jgi:hypothetical protein
MDLVELGGVRLASELWPIEPKSCPSRSAPFSRPGSTVSKDNRSASYTI